MAGGVVFTMLVLAGFWDASFFGWAKLVGLVWLAQYYFRFATSPAAVTRSDTAILVLAGLLVVMAFGDVYDRHKQTEFERGFAQLCGDPADADSFVCDGVSSLLESRHMVPFGHGRR